MANAVAPPGEAQGGFFYQPVQALVHIGPDMLVTIGLGKLPYGPRRVSVSQKNNVVEQLTMGAVYVFAYGRMPREYKFEGWSNGGDTQASYIYHILASFPDEQAVADLMVPALGIIDTVRLVDYNIQGDAQTAPGEPYYSLTLRTCGGQVTRI